MRAVELAGVLAAAAALVLAVLRWTLLRRRSVPGGVARLAQAIPEALGDAVLAVDRSGRICLANTAAARLTGSSVPELMDREVGDVAPELAALARGLERGPATARLAVPGPSGPVQVRAAAVRVSARPPMALAVLRPVRAPAPAPPAPGPWAERGDGRAGLAAAADALREPVAEAADAVSMLRLGAPPLAARAAAALAAAEKALEVARRRLAAVAAAAQGAGARRPVDVAALVEDVVATFPSPAGVRLRFELGAARALADDRPLRAALRELLGTAAAAVAGGGEIAVSVRERGPAAVVEIRTPAAVPAGGLALARALVVPQGGRVEDEALPGAGSAVRITLESAPALAPA